VTNFCRPYLSNSRAFGTVVVRPSVRLSLCSSSVTDALISEGCEIKPRLLMITNRKSYIGFQMKINIVDLG